jgi:AraC-like DNA-binding protein
VKPHLLKVPLCVNNSFSYNQYSLPNINSRWHYHPEIELIQIHRGSGIQFMGDSIKPFKAGDIILVGSNMPHFWKYDEVLNDKDYEELPYSTVIHFTDKLWGDGFINMPENILLKDLLEKAKRGLLLGATVQQKVQDLLAKIGASNGTYRLVYLLECLAIIAESNEISPLSSMGFQYEASKGKGVHERINIIYDFALQHFQEQIPLAQIASHAGLVPSSFCRYFKSKTGKSFTTFILELRVGLACRLLLEQDSLVKKVCYDSGFNNFSSFHKHFKSITGLSPQNYQRAQEGGAPVLVH